MADKKNFDVVVIGSGPGGYVAAIRAAQNGKKTAIIEREALGGICLNWGCIPTKALIHTAEVYDELQESKGGVFTLPDLGFDWSKIIERSRGVAGKMNQGVVHLMKKNKIEVIYGTASLLGPKRIKVEAKMIEGALASEKEGGDACEVEAQNIIIATGARASSLPNVEIDGEKIIDYRQAMVLDEKPAKMAIIGGGAIGLEFAYFYNSFGTEVTILEYLPKVFPAGDDEVSQALGRELSKQGIKINTGSAVQSVEKTKSGVKVTFKKGDKTEKMEADIALMAIGFRPNIEGLNLEALGVKVNKGGIEVDEFCRTGVPGVYAIGDVIGQPALAHVASAEALVAADHIAGKSPRPIDYSNVPGCVYCQPQVASVGLTEAQAKEQGLDYKVGKFPFMANGRAVAQGAPVGFVKLIADKKYGEILGAHIIGHDATEMIHEIVVAKAAELTIDDIADTIHSHPTESEAIMEAAHVWHGAAIHI